ncbi:hypothetical protein I79_016592 [Cricetulus griseus]|uniref:Uncharacterized protein n=1 Tax=Cricetulus griseus TaxID=10029 RepID=G3HZS8_CRIGR|nr:hypothetical protein I79_016592 [Cricetulus griseus]
MYLGIDHNRMQITALASSITKINIIAPQVQVLCVDGRLHYGLAVHLPAGMVQQGVQGIWSFLHELLFFFFLVLLTQYLKTGMVK